MEASGFNDLACEHNISLVSEPILTILAISAETGVQSLLLPILHHGSSATSAHAINLVELDLGARVVKDLYFVVIKKYNDKIQDDVRMGEAPIADLNLIGLSAKVEYMIAHEHKRFFSR